jgi:hypothetical protein
VQVQVREAVLEAMDEGVDQFGGEGSGHDGSVLRVEPAYPDWPG